ncbi:hypothetical protein IE077_000225 [Cardiosporidium cionae]|uniref:Uncharacterized protein n=1 Tax=Cardiosporidium cionae TaxID=476202 RepID=A0ABQ7JC97_9APIC|nr:hypothetical protein IE077_000225 [Cardiosporidium cionae]|eukprot:KAF8821646.1 hypothetical protein IE077_000225 [Cardiosporidium cionae]
MSASIGVEHSLALRYRLLSASRFLKPPGKFKRAEMREKPRVTTGPFENPTRRFVRLREKARAFDMLPPPRIIPVAKTYTPTILQRVEGVPKVSPAALEHRLHFLLSEKAEQQQLHAKLRPGITPFQAELFMIDLRKIYRAQYLQKLSEVTEEEQKIQKEQLYKEKEERLRRKEAIHQRIFDDKKRRALLKDRLRIEKKVTQSATMARLSKRKIAHLYWLLKLQRSTDLIGDDAVKSKFLKETNELFNRNISVPDILQQLGQNDHTEKSVKKKITGTYNVIQSLLEKSFSILPEDEPQFEPPASKYGRMTARQRAHLMYSGFSEEDKLNVLQEKIELLNMKIEQESKKEGELRSSFYIQLRDQIEAAKQAFLEKKHLEDAKARAMKESTQDEGDTV